MQAQQIKRDVLQMKHVMAVLVAMSAAPECLEDGDVTLLEEYLGGQHLTADEAEQLRESIASTKKALRVRDAHAKLAHARMRMHFKLPVSNAQALARESRWLLDEPEIAKMRDELAKLLDGMEAYK